MDAFPAGVGPPARVGRRGEEIGQIRFAGSATAAVADTLSAAAASVQAAGRPTLV
jgi:hypothetical protein